MLILNEWRGTWRPMTSPSCASAERYKKTSSQQGTAPPSHRRPVRSSPRIARIGRRGGGGSPCIWRTSHGLGRPGGAGRTAAREPARGLDKVPGVNARGRDAVRMYFSKHRLGRGPKMFHARIQACGPRLRPPPWCAVQQGSARSGFPCRSRSSPPQQIGHSSAAHRDAAGIPCRRRFRARPGARRRRGPNIRRHRRSDGHIAGLENGSSAHALVVPGGWKPNRIPA